MNAAHWRDSATVGAVGLRIGGRDRPREASRGLRRVAVPRRRSGARPHASESIATVERLLDSTEPPEDTSPHVGGIGLLRAFLGDRPGAEAAHREATSIVDELGQRRSRVPPCVHAYALDDFPDALRLARIEAADLERRGETGQRSTMVGLEAWMLALTGEDDDRAAGRQPTSPTTSGRPMTPSRRSCGVRPKVSSSPGAARPRTADRISAEGVDDRRRARTRFEAGTAWLARAMVAVDPRPRRRGDRGGASSPGAATPPRGSSTAVRRAEALIAP